MRALLFCTVIALALASCASIPPAGPMMTDAVPVAGMSLKGTEWQVFEIGGTPIVANSQPTITFEDGKVFGAGSCNRYFGSYTNDAELGITLGQMASSMMACADPQMQQESKFLGILGEVNAYALSADGTLTLTAKDGRTVKARKKA